MRASCAPSGAAAKECGAIVVVVIPQCHEHGPAHQPRRLAVADAFLDVRQGQTELAQSRRRGSLRRGGHFR